MDYQVLLQRMQALLQQAEQEAYPLAEREQIRKDIRALEKWLKSGQAGNPPADLERYVGEEAPAGADKTSAAIAPPAEKAGTTSEVQAESFDEEAIAREEAAHNYALLHADLEQVRRLLSEGKYRQAIGLASQVAIRASGELKISAEDLLYQAQTALQQELERYIEQADSAYQAGQEEKARRLYLQILELDPEYTQARRALANLDRHKSQAEQQGQMARLRAGLRERRDIRRLGEAVYEAEALDAEDRLPPELMDLLKEARAAFDDLRRQHGEETTMMRYGDVKSRAEAVKRFEEYLVKRQETVWDAVTNSYRPTVDALREARARLEEISRDTAQYELSLAEKFKHTRPEYVKKRLEKALEQPFQDNDRKKLEEKLQDVEEFVQAQEKADQLVQKAQEIEDPVERLSLLLQAYRTFPNLLGLDAQIQQTTQSAAKTLEGRLNDLLSNIQNMLARLEFDQIRSKLAQAQDLLSRWSAPELPPSLHLVDKQIRDLWQQATEQEKAYHEYQSLAERIRQMVKNPQERTAALDLFEKNVAHEARFQAFPDLAVLRSELDAYKTADQQWQEALQARARGDWRRAFEIAQGVLQAGKGGQLTAQFQEILEEARLELNLARFQEFLDRDEIAEANSLLSNLLEREHQHNPERAQRLRERLHGEIEHIQQVIQNSPPFEKLYQQACSSLELAGLPAIQAFERPAFVLRQAQPDREGKVSSPELRRFINSLKDSADAPDPSPEELRQKAEAILLEHLKKQSLEKRATALHLLRYIGGLPVDSVDPSWPPYTLSLQTPRARQTALLVTRSIQQDAVQALVKDYRQFRSRTDELDRGRLQELARYASILHSLSLLYEEEERSAARWAEIEWARRIAQEEERLGNWESVLKIWKNIADRYPTHSEVKQAMRHARIQQTLLQARSLIYNHHRVEEAIQLIEARQGEPTIENAWELTLVLAEAYAELRRFDRAFALLQHLQNLKATLPAEVQQTLEQEVMNLQTAIQQKQIIMTYLEQADQRHQQGNSLEALRILQEGLANSRLRDPTPLQEMHDRIFQEASERLSQQAEAGQNRGSDEGKIEAVTALVELQAMEDMASVPPKHRRSTRGLKRLRSELAGVAETVLRAASDFDPTLMPLKQAIQRAEMLSNRLQIFDNVIPLFNEELEPVRESLTKRRRELATWLENLNELDKLLERVSSPEVWQNAFRQGNFQELQQAVDQINRLELSNMAEARTLAKRLEETQEAYHYLLRKVEEIKHVFLQEEDFSKVQQQILETAVQPSLRANGQMWQTLQAEEYQTIRQIVGERLRIFSPHDQHDLIGWDAVQHEAQIRQAELERWQEWDRRCATLMDQAEMAFRQAANQETTQPLRIQRDAWQRAYDLSKNALETLTFELSPADPEVSPRREVGLLDEQGHRLPTRSSRAYKILEEGKRRKEIAEYWLHCARTELESLDARLRNEGFPTEKEFAEAARLGDITRLEVLLRRAEQAGILTEQEQRRVETYRRTLEIIRSEKARRSFWDLFR